MLFRTTIRSYEVFSNRIMSSVTTHPSLRKVSTEGQYDNNLILMRDDTTTLQMRLQRLVHMPKPL
jgi:hypothetical protein